MKSIQITIENNVGLHARPATLFVQTAKKHKSNITVSHDGKTVNAKSLLNLLLLNDNKVVPPKGKYVKGEIRIGGCASKGERR